MLKTAYMPQLSLTEFHTPSRPLHVATFVCPSVPGERSDPHLSFGAARSLDYDGFGVSDYAAISYVNDQVSGVSVAAGAFYGKGRVDMNRATEDQREMARLKFVRDGLSQTVLLGERFDTANQMQGWITKWPFDNLTPRTARINDHESGRALASAHTGGVYVSMCDGHVEFIDESTDAFVYEAILTRRGNDTAVATSTARAASM